MATDQLTINSASGAQTTTGTPQPATQAGLSPGSNDGNVQTDTTNSLLTSSSGQTLHPTPLPTASLSGATSTSSSTAAPTPAPKHHLNVPLLGVSVVLLAAALVLVWLANKSSDKLKFAN